MMFEIIQINEKIFETKSISSNNFKFIFNKDLLKWTLYIEKEIFDLSLYKNIKENIKELIFLFHDSNINKKNIRIIKDDIKKSIDFELLILKSSNYNFIDNIIEKSIENFKNKSYENSFKNGVCIYKGIYND